ncbi:AsmA family protein [Thiomicrorhabdus sp. zzn3]|uniref:AsmA family protein n=1 Tax=Thiomicrorhabdus sp. zzn3 TaxID=3039775 RepID=UPI002436F954|nr:AsmA family protein [Thiomicrorhabdus sp. zzn3]MDG6778635.1 AsmA family protein [Thiomicrorhabdus sp. zzn3]
MTQQQTPKKAPETLPETTSVAETETKESALGTESVARSSSSIWRWSKRLLMVGMILPLLLFLGFAAAISLIDFNQYKPQIEQEVTERTGHQFDIEGAIEVSVFPFTFSLEKVSLKNREDFAEAFGQNDMLSVKRIQVEVSMWDLFIHKRLSVKGLELIEPNLVLLRNAHGDNWQRLATTVFPSIHTSDLRKQVKSLEAQERWEHYLVKAALAPEVANAEKIPLPSAEDLSVPSDNSTLSPPSASLDSSAPAWQFDSVVIQNGRFELQDSVVNHQAVVSELNLLAFHVKLGEPFKIRTDFAYHNTLQARHYGFDVAAMLDISQGLKRWQVNDWQGVMKLKLPEEQKVPEMRLVTEGESFNLNLQEDRIQVVKARLNALGSQMTASFSGSYGAQANLYGDLLVNGFNVQNWARHLGLQVPEFVNKKALTEVKGQISWELKNQRLNFDDIQLSWDRSTLTGNMRRERIGTDSRYHFDLAIDQLNLEDYRALRTDSSGSVSDTPGDNSYLPLAVPISTLRALNAEGVVKVAALRAWGVDTQDVVMQLQAEQGTLTLAPFNAQLYQGKLESSLILNVNGETPSYHWQGKIQQVDFGALSTAAWQASPLDGLYDAKFDLKTLGTNGRVLRQNLQGSLLVDMRNGHFYGFDLDRALSGQGMQFTDKWPYQRLILEGKWTNGIYLAKKVQVKAQGLQAKGQAKVDLNRLQVEAPLSLTLTKPPRSFAFLKGVILPLLYQGALDQPHWTVDLSRLK